MSSARAQNLGNHFWLLRVQEGNLSHKILGVLEVEWMGEGRGAITISIWPMDDEAMNKRMTHRCAPVFLRIFQQNTQKKCTLVIPKGNLPLRHAFHSLLWRKGHQLNTPFIKKRRYGGKVRHGADKHLGYLKKKKNNKHSNHPGRLVLWVLEKKGEIINLSRREGERSANCAARGSRRSSLLQTRDWRSGSSHGRAIPVRLVSTKPKYT